MPFKYESKVKLCYMDTDNFVYETETKNFYKDITKDVKTRFDTSGYSKDESRPLPIGKSKEVMGMRKDNQLVLKYSVDQFRPSTLWLTGVNNKITF